MGLTYTVTLRYSMAAALDAATRRKMELTGYHGLTQSIYLCGPWRGRAMYVSFDRSLALAVAKYGGVYAVRYEASCPLVLDTPALFRHTWEASGAPFPRVFSTQRRRLEDYCRKRGSDAIVLPASAFGGEYGYAWVAGLFGEPQAILLAPERAVLTPC